jgi:hypothetical protein
VKFVRDNRHTESIAADQNPAFDASIGNFLRDRDSVVGIIDWLIIVGTKVFDIVPISRQQGNKFAFDLKSTMITSNGDSHCFYPVISNESNLRR